MALLSKCQNHKADCANFCGLLRKAELYPPRVQLLQVYYSGLNLNSSLAHFTDENFELLILLCDIKIFQLEKNNLNWTNTIFIRGFRWFLDIKVLWRLQFLIGYRPLSLKFQKARTKIEVVLSLPSWLSELNWDRLGRLRTTSILVLAFWNFKLKGL